MMLLQQQQKLRGPQLSPQPPGPPGSGPAGQRIPSPQDLVAHTQQIMQNALIKRKLEEQKESYRKRMEGGDKAPDQGQGSLAFTPTVVMKKLAAERRDSDPKLQAQDPAARIGPHGDQGDRISPNRLFETAARATGDAQAAAVAAAMQQQQLRMQHQLAMIQHQRGGPLPVPGPPQNFPAAPAGTMGPGGPGGMGPVPGGPQGSQLSRFFSPEVLAQAQNSVPPALPSQAMTLEEIERRSASVRM